MPSDIGSQTITVKFFDPVDSVIANAIATGVRKVGIYSGGYLTKVNDTTATLSIFDCEISDGTYQIRGTTGTTVNITVGPAVPYVILRWIYTGSAANDYIALLGVALGSILSTDIVVGKCTFAGITLTGFDYTSRTNPNVFDLFLKVEPESPVSMYVRVRAGRVCYGGSNFDIIDQNSPLLVAPGSNSWIALIQISTSGAVVVTYGASAASPVAPTYGGLITIAEITIGTGQTTITSVSIKDVRSFTGSAAPMITGDWIISTVATPRAGWTNVSATYSDKFIRINATPLTTGGADAHTHGVGSYAGASHTHGAGSLYFSCPVSLAGGCCGGAPNVTPGNNYTLDGGQTAAGGTAVITGTSASSSNIPAYVQVVIFQKN